MLEARLTREGTGFGRLLSFSWILTAGWADASGAQFPQSALGVSSQVFVS